MKDKKILYEKGFLPPVGDDVIAYLTMSQAKVWHPLSQHRQVPSNC